MMRHNAHESDMIFFSFITPKNAAIPATQFCNPSRHIVALQVGKRMLFVLPTHTEQFFFFKDSCASCGKVEQQKRKYEQRLSATCAALQTITAP